MGEVTTAAILEELREFRKENNERWNANDKKWEQNDKRWEQNERRWEENTRRWNENEKRWKENNERWNLNEKRWEENTQRWNLNEKRWEENTRRWNENDKQWKENTQRWNLNDKKWEENKKEIHGINQRLSHLENGRKKDRREIIEVLDTMQKSISESFSELKQDMDSKFEKIMKIQMIHEKEHARFIRTMRTHGIRLNVQDSRITYLEKWKKECGGDDCIPVS